MGDDMRREKLEQEFCAAAAALDAATDRYRDALAALDAYEAEGR